MDDARPDGLLAHERQVARDLETLGLPAANWPARRAGPDGEPALDVVVIGAGMNGVAAAASLLLKGVRNIRVLDRSEPGREGPWLTSARMDTLRSPKTLPGPALGIPSLTYRAWHEASFGRAHWEALYKIPNALWARYLAWLQRVLSLPVAHGTAVERIVPGPDFVRIETRAADGEATLLARRVILATGRGGAGGTRMPFFVDPALLPDRAVHTNEAIDFARLAGRAVAVIGGGASAWDNAATALEAGAARVDMYIRREALPQINKGRGSAHPGYFHGWRALDDTERWSLFVYLNDAQAPPPHETVRRGLRQPGLHVHLGKPVAEARPDGDGVGLRLVGEKGPRRHDFLIFGTGFAVDAGTIPELGAAAGAVARWRDRFEPPPDLARDELDAFPYLGPGFELQERRPDDCPGLGRIHLVNHGAALSHGAIASDIPGVNVAAERAATAIVEALFREDIDAVRRDLEAFDEPELEGTPFFKR